jgi:hypothetical protein
MGGAQGLQQVSGGAGAGGAAGAWSHEWCAPDRADDEGRQRSGVGSCAGDPLLSGFYTGLGLPLDATALQVRQWLTDGRPQ